MKEIFELRRVTDLSISLSNSPTDAHTLLIDPLHGVEPREAYLSSAICLCLVGGLLPSDWFVSQAASLPIGSLGGDFEPHGLVPALLLLPDLPYSNGRPLSCSPSALREVSHLHTRPCTLVCSPWQSALFGRRLYNITALRADCLLCQ